MWFQILAGFIILVLSIKFLLGLKGNKNVTKTIPGMKPTHSEKGNIPDMNKSESIGHFLYDLHKKYGPIASFWEGKKRAVSVATPQLFKQMRHLFLVPTEIFEGFQLLSGDGKGMGFCGIEETRRRRKFYEEHFMMRACKSYSDCFSKIAIEYVKKWEGLQKGEKLPLVAATAEATLSALSRTTYGDMFEDETKLKRFHELNDYVFRHLVRLPPVESPEYKQILKNIEKLKGFVKEALELRRKTKDSDDQRLFIDVLIEEDFKEEERLADAFLMISAGYQTSSSHIAWILFQLCKNPEIQEKLYESIQSVAGEEPITMEVTPKLTYLKQVLEEGLRFFQLYGFSVRTAHEDMELGGYTIPEGTRIYNGFCYLNKDPKYFWDAERFNPDHFSAEEIRSRNPWAFKPFGFAGKRHCLGQTFALSEASIYIAEWCRHFRFRLAPGQKENVGLTGFFQPEEEIMVTLEPRK